MSQESRVTNLSTGIQAQDGSYFPIVVDGAFVTLTADATINPIQYLTVVNAGASGSINIAILEANNPASILKKGQLVKIAVGTTTGGTVKVKVTPTSLTALSTAPNTLSTSIAPVATLAAVSGNYVIYKYLGKNVFSVVDYNGAAFASS